MKKIEEAAKSVEAAIDAGLAKLGCTRDMVDIEIISEGGVFSKARVVLTTKPTPGERAVEFVERVLKQYKTGALVELHEEEKEAVLDIIGTDVMSIIGEGGETIDAVQYIASLIANKDSAKYCRIIIDSEDYRAQRENKLREFAISTAERAIEQGRWIRLKPMNSHERRIVHSALAGNEGVTTHSEGDEPNRCLIIVPGNVKYEPRKPGSDRPFGSRDGRRTDGRERRSGDRPDRNGGGRPGYGDRPRGDRADGRRSDRNDRGDRGGRSGYGDDRRGPRSGYGGGGDRPRSGFGGQKKPASGFSDAVFLGKSSNFEDS